MKYRLFVLLTIIGIIQLPSHYKAQIFDFTVTPQSLCSGVGSQTVLAAQTASYPGAIGYWWLLSGPSSTCNNNVWMMGNTFSAAVISLNCCGTYTITHQAFTSPGPTPAASITKVFNYHCPAQPSFAITNSSAGLTVCPGSSLNLSVSGPYNYTWSTGSSNSPLVVSPTVNTSYHATGKDLNGCSYSATTTISVGRPTIQVTQSETPYCAGNSGTLIASGADTYTWNGGGTSSAQTFVVTGTTIFTVTGTKNSCDGTATYTVVPVNPSAFNYTLNGLQLDLSIASGCNSFEWDFGNGAGSTINSNPIVTYVNPGIYSVCLKCNGFPSSCTRCINLAVPGQLSGGVDLKEEVADLHAFIFPNPFAETLGVQVESETILTAYLLTGELVLERHIVQAGLTFIDLSYLPPTVYLFKLENKQAAHKLFKITKVN